MAAPRRNPSGTSSDPRLKPDSLAYALLDAAQVSLAVRQGQSLTEALALSQPRMAVLATGRSHPAGAIQDIAYRTQRGRGRADAWLALLADREWSPPLLRELLVTALALLELTQQASSEMPAEVTPHAAPYPAFTIVDQAVTAAAASPELRPAKGLVNGVLRRYLREYAQHLPQILRSDEARWNHPDWWIAVLRVTYPAQWQDILTLSNRPPPLTLRVNRRKTSVTAYLDLLSQAGLAATAIGPSALRLQQPVPVTRLPGFADGLASVQDEAAQRAAFLLDVHDGMRVLDACAAPGGKTGHLLELAQLDLTALDLDAQRLVKVQENLDRLGLQARVVTGSASRVDDWWDGRPYDRILADVPCTASGIVRRHPDIRWLRRETDSATLSQIQQQILDALWRLLRPDGKFLFVTCSLFPIESRRQAEAFAARHADARALPAPGQLLPTDDGSMLEHDGLFYALFQKAA